MTGRGRHPERFLATILFTDMVGSTDLALRIGDSSWRRLVAAHHATVRRNLRKFGGTEHDTAGDGFFASFNQPAQAVRAADAILADVGGLGLSLRAGVHTGECEWSGPKVGGIAVAIAARVMSHATADEVLVSATVRDLLHGSGLGFEDRGTHELKGIPDDWRLYSLKRERHAPTDAAAAQQAAIAAITAADARQKRRRTSVLLAVGAVALIAVLAGAAVLGGALGTPAAVAAPGPNALVTLQRAGARVIEVRPVAPGPQAVVADAGKAWVAATDAAVLVSMPISGAVGDATVGRVGHPTDLAVGGGYVWIADAFSQTLFLVDPRDGDVTRTINDFPARSIAFGFDTLWVADDLSDSIRRIGSATETLARIELPTGAFPVSIATGAGFVWVANQGTSTIARIEPAANTVVNSAVPLRAIPSAISAGESDVWVASRAGDALMRLDSGADPAVTLTLENICDEPTTVLADTDGVWLGCGGSAPAVLHLSREGTELARIRLAGLPTSFAIDADRIFVTVRAP